MSAAPGIAMAQQAPWNASDVPVSHRDRVYASEQFSNTVSVTDPADNRLLGVIKLGDPQPMNFSPLYKGQVLVHGLGFSPDGKTLAVVSIGSNAVSWIDTATNTPSSIRPMSGVAHTRRSSRRTARRSGSTVRGEDYIAVSRPYDVQGNGAHQDARWSGYDDLLARWPIRLCLFLVHPVLAVFDVATHAQVDRWRSRIPFCPTSPRRRTASRCGSR